MISKEKFDRAYTSLILDLGLNFEKGMSLIIKCAPDYYSFAQKVAKEAYKKGALNVEISLTDLKLLKQRSKYQSIEEISILPSYIETADKERTNQRWALLAIADTENNTELANSDKEKISEYTKAMMKKTRAGRIERMNFTVPWLIVCYPLQKWARQTLGENATTQELRDVLAKILFLDKQDPIKQWIDWDNNHKKGNKYLTDLHIKSLHYKSPRTDLTLELNENAVWLGGSDTDIKGKRFFPNLPTFEHFSVPSRTKVNGYVTTTRPVTVLETLCNNIRFDFVDGKVVKCVAQTGQDAMDQFLDTDENYRYLGEVALVDERTPISQSQKVFNNILFDENASCHLAIGAGYPICLSNYKELDTDEKLHEYGCNTSKVHTDFMVGSSDLVITATTYSGETIVIYDHGKFTF